MSPFKNFKKEYDVYEDAFDTNIESDDDNGSDELIDKATNSDEEEDFVPSRKGWYYCKTRNKHR
ncbi:unnamed protein product [Mucor hiemalis]